MTELEKLSIAAKTDASVCPILADALEEANFAQELVSLVRTTKEYLHGVLHNAVTEKRVNNLLNQSKIAYAEKNSSAGYWYNQRAKIITTNLGIINAFTVDDLRGTPDPGDCWIRPATSGKWSKSRRNKFGKPLTIWELIQYLQAKSVSEERA